MQNGIEEIFDILKVDPSTARHRVGVRPYRGKPEEILYRPARDVLNLHDPEIQAIIDKMHTTMVAKNGVGLAAPQVGIPLRICIVSSQPNPLYPHAEKVPWFPLINPIGVRAALNKIDGIEACLSIPDHYALVVRPEWVTITYLDRYGNLCSGTFDGFLGRVVQHEMDHLDGLLLKDRLVRIKSWFPSRKLVPRAEFNEMVAKQTQAA